VSRQYDGVREAFEQSLQSMYNDLSQPLQDPDCCAHDHASSALTQNLRSKSLACVKRLMGMLHGDIDKVD
jgi:hypothetical protein